MLMPLVGGILSFSFPPWEASYLYKCLNGFCFAVSETRQDRKEKPRKKRKGKVCAVSDRGNIPLWQHHKMPELN